MDKRTLVKNLRSLFTALNEADGKYAEVWISDVDFGGLYYNGKFDLSLRASQKLESCLLEISPVIDMLHEKAPLELRELWSVAVYNPDDQVPSDQPNCISIFSTAESWQSPHSSIQMGGSPAA